MIIAHYHILYFKLICPYLILYYFLTSPCNNVQKVSRVELLDDVQVRAINGANGKTLPEVPTLLLEFVGTGNFQ